MWMENVGQWTRNISKDKLKKTDPEYVNFEDFIFKHVWVATFG